MLKDYLNQSCELEKKRVECAIMIQAVKSLERGQAE